MDRRVPALVALPLKLKNGNLSELIYHENCWSNGKCVYINYNYVIIPYYTYSIYYCPQAEDYHVTNSLGFVSGSFRNYLGFFVCLFVVVFFNTVLIRF